jgi:hypothetical protein
MRCECGIKRGIKRGTKRGTKRGIKHKPMCGNFAQPRAIESNPMV